MLLDEEETNANNEDLLQLRTKVNWFLLLLFERIRKFFCNMLKSVIHMRVLYCMQIIEKC